MTNKLRVYVRQHHVGLLCLSLLLAGGSAYAAATVGPNDIKPDAVRSRHIKAGNVKTGDLDDEAVTSAKLAPGSVTLSKLAPDAVSKPLAIDVLLQPSGYSGQDSSKIGTLAEVDGLTMVATCNNYYFDGSGHTRLRIDASTTGTNATLNWFFIAVTSASTGGVALNNNSSSVVDVTIDGNQSRQTNGTLIYREDGPQPGETRVSSIPLNYYVENQAGSFGKCWTQGTVTRATERA